MPIPQYIQKLRSLIGNEPLFVPAVSGVVFDASRRVLLQQSVENRTWNLPGGIMEPGEEPADACRREILEETGVAVRPDRIVGLYVAPEHTYANGDRVAAIIICFVCTALSGNPRGDGDESLDARFFAMDELPPLRASQRLRIEHALDEGPPRFILDGIWEPAT